LIFLHFYYIKNSEITILINNLIALKGNLNIPSNPQAFVIFSHAIGSSRFSSWNRFVAEILNQQHIATLLADLLTEADSLI
jgi:putative phosphoribosyl transferase